MLSDGVIALIAHGPNSIEMVCRFFADLESAHAWCDKNIFGPSVEETAGSFLGGCEEYKVIREWTFRFMLAAKSCMAGLQLL